MKKTLSSKDVAIVVIATLVLVMFAVLVGGSNSSTPTNSTTTVKCGSCGTTYQSNSTNGKSISRTNLCTSCYNSMKATQDALREMPVN